MADFNALHATLKTAKAALTPLDAAHAKAEDEWYTALSDLDLVDVRRLLRRALPQATTATLKAKTPPPLPPAPSKAEDLTRLGKALVDARSAREAATKAVTAAQAAIDAAG